MRLIAMAALAACLPLTAQASSDDGYNPTADLAWLTDWFAEADGLVHVRTGTEGERRALQIDVGNVRGIFAVEATPNGPTCYTEHFLLDGSSPTVNYQDIGCDGSLERVAHASEAGFAAQPLTDSAQLEYGKAVDFYAGSLRAFLRFMDYQPHITALENQSARERRTAGTRHETYLRGLIDNQGAGGPNPSPQGYFARFYGDGVRITLQYRHVEGQGHRIFTDEPEGQFAFFDANNDFVADEAQVAGTVHGDQVWYPAGLEQATIEAWSAHILEVLATLADSEVWFMSDYPWNSS